MPVLTNRFVSLAAVGHFQRREYHLFFFVCWKGETSKSPRGFMSRAAIEPTIWHLKFDHRMSCNFLKGVAGDVMNLLLAAAAFNFKRAMNALLCFILKYLLIQKHDQY
jgi:IS5 family transposase